MAAPRRSRPARRRWRIVVGAADGDPARRQPRPRGGGSGRLAEALTGLVTAHGAEIRSGVEVDAIVTTGGRATGVRTTDGEQLTATQAVIASTTPDQLYGRLLRDAAGIPESTRVQARGYRYRRGCFQISLALSARPRLAGSRLDARRRVHVGSGLNQLLASLVQS